MNDQFLTTNHLLPEQGFIIQRRWGRGHSPPLKNIILQFRSKQSSVMQDFSSSSMFESQVSPLRCLSHPYKLIQNICSVSSKCVITQSMSIFNNNSLVPCTKSLLKIISRQSPGGSTVKPPIMDPPRSGQPLYSGQRLFCGLKLLQY